MKKTQIIVWISALVGFGWIGLNTYHYFLDKKNPELIVSGIGNDHYYAGDIACIVNGSHSYKVKKISVFLDGTPLIYNFTLNKKSFEHPFTINTRALTNGKHDLKVSIVDGTYQSHETTKDYTFNVDNTPLQAAFVKQNNDVKVFQGKTVVIQFQVSKALKEAKVHAFSKTFNCVPEKVDSLIYETFIPIDCEETPNEYPFTITCTDHVENVVTLEGKLQVIPFPFKKQNLTIDDDYAKQQKELGQSQTLLNDQLVVLAQRSPQKKLWQGQIGRASCRERVSSPV